MVQHKTTLKCPWTHEEEIKKSRFIANAVRTDSPEEALEQVEQLSDGDASHNCWAYKIGDQYRFADDGEPGGTAGRPILAAIEGQGLDGVLVVVTRFFGGTKLGAGGLARAYGGTAAKCLRQAPKLEIKEKIVLNVGIPFSAIGVLYPILDELGAVKLSETYEQDGVSLRIELLKEKREAFETALSDATRGAAVIGEEPLP